MGTTNKVNKAIFYVMNLVIMLPFIVKHMTGIHFAITAVLLLVFLYGVVFKSNPLTPATAYLPLLVFCDVCIAIGINFELLKASFHKEYFTYVFKVFPKEGWYLICLGFALWIIGLYKAKLSLLTEVGIEIVLGAIILVYTSNLDYKDFVISEDGKTLLAILTLSVVLWTITYQSSKITRKISGLAWLETFLFAGMIALLTVEVDLLGTIKDFSNSYLMSVPSSLLVWWKVIISCIILWGCAFVMYDSENDSGINADSYSCISATTIIITLKLLTKYYFCYNWIVMLVLLISIIYGYKLISANKDTIFNILLFDYTIYLIPIACLTIICLNKGLWLNVVITFICALALYRKHKHFKKFEYKSNDFWTFILVAIVAEAAAWMWRFRFSKEAFIILAVILVMGWIVIRISNIKHANNYSPNNNGRICVAVLICLLCLLSMRKYGSKISVEPNMETNKTTISVMAKGKNNSVSNAYYYWTDGKGKKLGENKDFTEATKELTIKSELLTVVVTDSNGVQTTTLSWYPKWLIKTEEKKSEDKSKDEAKKKSEDKSKEKSKDKSKK